MASLDGRTTSISQAGNVFGADSMTGLDGLLIDGVDAQAAWRAHLRELTTARQAVERQSGRAFMETQAQYERRRAEMVETLERIDAEHRAWLRAHMFPERHAIADSSGPWVSEAREARGREKARRSRKQ